MGVGDGQRARGSHRVQSKGYSEEGGKRTGQGRGERGAGEKFGRGFRRKKEGVCWAGKLLTIAGAGKEGVSTRIGGGTRGGTRGAGRGEGWRAKRD